MMSAVPTPTWTPTADDVASARITAFGRWLREERGVDVGPTYDDLWRWSVTDLPGFWSAVWDYFEVTGTYDRERVLPVETMPGAVWFEGAMLNYAEEALGDGADDDPAVIGLSEGGPTVRVSRGELRQQVGAFAASLRSMGVGSSDRVVGYLPDIPETIVAFLATVSLGAVWSSVGQDYAAPAVIDRFAQLEATVLVAADGYHFSGRAHPREDAVRAVRAGLPTLTHTVLVTHLGTGTGVEDALDWADLTAGEEPFRAVPVAFDHPLWVLFSSGTTGTPKGLVHGHGGVVLDSYKTLALHLDLGLGDVLFWYTSPSWIMWNLRTAALLTGTTAVCFDGSPTHRDGHGLWEVVAESGATYFGTSPGFLLASQKGEVQPATRFDLSALRAIGATGSPVADGSFHWVADEFGGRMQLGSMSGGTDVASGFAASARTVPVWPGELSVRCLAVAMEAWDDEGRSVVNQVGELVVTRPMPTMPLYLWNDADGSRHHESYFDTFPGVWRHGDWITVTSRGSVVVHGRSDATLNRNGVRMGSADIYQVVEAFPEVREALVLGVEEGAGYWMPLFVVLADDTDLDDALRARLVAAIRRDLSPRHVPDEIRQVAGLPHTRTGKKLEVPVKRLFQGAPLETVADPGALDDPAQLAAFARMADARSHG